MPRRAQEGEDLSVEMGQGSYLAARWSIGHWYAGLKPVRIVVPTWGVICNATTPPTRPRVSREEILALFATDLSVTGAARTSQVAGVAARDVR